MYRPMHRSNSSMQRSSHINLTESFHTASVDTGPTPLLKAVGRDRRNQTYAARPSRDYYNEIIPNRTEVQMRNVIGASCLAIACSPVLGSRHQERTQREAKGPAGANEGMQRQAGDKKGDERKAFMSKCLNGEDAALAAERDIVKGRFGSAIASDHRLLSGNLRLN